MILYLHGFRSSPQSFKARMLAERVAAAGMGDQWCCPQLPPGPRDAMHLVESLLAGVPAEQVALIGSSLGGFYATWLAERHGCRAALLNPAVHPARDLDRYLGEQPLWHGEGSIRIEPHHLDELRALMVRAITRPERYYLLAATGDEVLDYRDMLEHYQGAPTTLIEGSNHGIADFARYADGVLAFCSPAGGAGVPDSVPPAGCADR